MAAFKRLSDMTARQANSTVRALKLAKSASYSKTKWPHLLTARAAAQGASQCVLDFKRAIAMGDAMHAAGCDGGRSLGL